MFSEESQPRNQRVDHDYLETPSGLHVMQEGQAIMGSMTLEVDGYLPSVIGHDTNNTNRKYRVPDENVERIEHLYARNDTNATSAKNAAVTGKMKNNTIKRFVSFLLIVVVVLFGVVVGTVCGTGYAEQFECYNPTR
jgi:hypothetical protein